MSLVSIKYEKRGKKQKSNDRKDHMIAFFNVHYKKLMKETDTVYRDHLLGVLQPSEDEIITNINTNISEHYISHIRFYIKVYLKIDQQISSINKNTNLNDTQKKQQREQVYKLYNSIISDIINIKSNMTAPGIYHMIIYRWRNDFFPYSKLYIDDPIPYDIKVNPQDYLPNMIGLCRMLEDLNKDIIRDTPVGKTPCIHKLFNVLPLRTSITPKYINLDTRSIVDLFITEGAYQLTKNSGKAQVAYKIWSTVFNLENTSFFRKGYIFDNNIKTDGIGCTIRLIKSYTVDGGIEGEDPVQLAMYPPSRKATQLFNDHIVETKYIEDIEITDEMKEKKIGYIDPGLGDIISCMTENPVPKNERENMEYKKDQLDDIFYTYTQAERSETLKIDRYRVIRSTEEDSIVGNKTVKEHIETLKEFNSKTAYFGPFLEYLSKKLSTNRKLYPHFRKDVYRCLRWNSYNNKRRSETDMIRGFRKKIGKAEDTLVILGDYSNRGFKGKAPSITKKIRKIFRNNGYETYLIDEYCTSKCCSCCGGRVENFVERENEYLVWKLVRCTICKSIHNRDHNATKNMRLIVTSIIEGHGRPYRFKRKQLNG